MAYGDELRELIASNDEWLIDRILAYAKERNYTKYTSTLREAWRMSISGLSSSLLDALGSGQADLELGPDMNYSQDPTAYFGIEEARKHRERGVSLDMFLGLMKYYRQSYADLLRQAQFEASCEEQYLLLVERFFDRMEIGFCTEWTALSEKELLEELQSSNRTITNEKNKYLTVFESISNPAILLNDKDIVDNMNHLAVKLLQETGIPGGQYYKRSSKTKTFSGKNVKKLFPWLVEEVTALKSSKSSAIQHEKKLPSKEGVQYFTVNLSKMLDVSGKFAGTLIVLEDITERRLMEEQLHELSMTDELTGLFNRRGSLAMADKLINICQRGNCELYVLYIDFDNLKWINDHLGHKAGDAALVETADILKNTFRQADVIGRLGGDEFIVLITDKTNTDNEYLMLKRLEENLKKSSARKGRKYEISISLGIAKYDQTAPCSLDEMLSQADQSMYQSKEKKKKARQGAYKV